MNSFPLVLLPWVSRSLPCVCSPPHSRFPISALFFLCAFARSAFDDLSRICNELGIGLGHCLGLWVRKSMAEGGNRHLGKMDSTESRWAARDEEVDSNEEGDDSSHRMSFVLDEDEVNVEQRLIRTGPRIDSFDVEALEILGAHRNNLADDSLGRHIVLALQTLGVVFGDVGTSPLYTLDVMFNKYPLVQKEDVLGALSLVLYTLILLSLVKYILVVLWANDDGEGGTFALYSLICRNAKASLLPNQLPSDAHISSFRLKVPSPELERSLKIREHLEKSIMLKKLLLILVLFGTSMVIADGGVTPAMSVMSALNGLKVGISSVEQG